MPKNLTIGVDVGGTKIYTGLISPAGKILRTTRTLTYADRGKKAVINTILESVADVWSEDVTGIGIGIAGSVDHANGKYLRGPNFSSSFRNIPLARDVQKVFKVPTVIDNDVHCFALGEAMFGRGKGKSTVVGMTLGTGIGGGIVLDGRLLRGRNNTAGELGHMVIAADSTSKCSCKKHGHLEGFSSGKALATAYTLKTKKKLEQFWDFEELANDGDRAALAVIKVSTRYLAAGIANILHIIDPDVVIIGGGGVKIRPLWGLLKEEIKENLAYPHLFNTPVVKSSLKDKANILGAAYLARIS